MKVGDMAFHKDRGITVVSGFPQKGDSAVVIAGYIDQDSDRLTNGIFSINDLISLDVDPRLEEYKKLLLGADR